MMTRLEYERIEENLCAPYAQRSSESQGRVYPEKEHDFRTAFQRDRDRIIHSTAFRRLQYKTQVFVNHEGDHYRTRLTHTLETCQIARTIARVLHLNEDLVEAIALAHDLGHGPFGHAGEWALAEMMKDHGGFDHNIQALRIVEKLEESYDAFPGLNLTFETREGLKKHPERFYRDRRQRFRTLEAEVVDIADEIAYNTHDLDDGLRAGMLEEQHTAKIKLWKEASLYIQRKKKKIEGFKRRRLLIRLIMNRLVTDLVKTTAARIEKLDIRTVKDLQKTQRPVVQFSPAVAEQHKELRAFLHQHLYRHHRVIRMTDKAQRFLKALFQSYLHNPEQLPPEVQRKADGIHRAICDYLAGMTDRFALDEYKRLFEPYERV